VLVEIPVLVISSLVQGFDEDLGVQKETQILCSCHTKEHQTAEISDPRVLFQNGLFPFADFGFWCIANRVGARPDQGQGHIGDKPADAL